MNLTKPGWLRRYLDFRRVQAFPERLPSTGARLLADDSVHNSMDEAIYYFIQPTGIMYGLPTRLPDDTVTFPKSKYHSSQDWALLAFLESLFGCLVADRHFLLEGLAEEEDRLTPAIDVAAQYFLHDQASAPEGMISSITRIIRRTDRLESALLHQLRPAYNRFRTPQLFSNSYLFMDLYNCILWQRNALMGGGGPDMLDELVQGQRAQKLALIRLVIAAGWSDNMLSRYESYLVSQLIRGSRLPAVEQRALQQIAERGIGLDEIDLPPMPWLLRRFILELIMLMVLIDQEFNQRELAFVEAMIERLGLWPVELEQSRTALELFLMNQHDRLFYLDWRPSVFGIGDRLRERATLAVRANLDSIVTEIRETQELYTLLMKSTRQKLDAEEKAKVRAQLMDILKTIPALAIFALPGGGLALPIVIRLLPFNILPSAFDD